MKPDEQPWRPFVRITAWLALSATALWAVEIAIFDLWLTDAWRGLAPWGGRIAGVTVYLAIGAGILCLWALLTKPRNRSVRIVALVGVVALFPATAVASGSSALVGGQAVRVVAVIATVPGLLVTLDLIVEAVLNGSVWLVNRRLMHRGRPSLSFLVDDWLQPQNKLQIIAVGLAGGGVVWLVAASFLPATPLAFPGLPGWFGALPYRFRTVVDALAAGSLTGGFVMWFQASQLPTADAAEVSPTPSSSGTLPRTAIVGLAAVAGGMLAYWAMRCRGRPAGPSGN
ncbi:MAG: hypothetical protein QOF60_3186 [Actinomycetota bacterium]|jgi:hypothetical protein|nr:hypothetical protein [Actinomycetota bacterium]